ncbi:MAG: glutamate formimidoyltransferase [Acidobacteria bacterium]|nr:glutamate formimidoyltransferase [Acidobacteriota bacterium]
MTGDGPLVECVANFSEGRRADVIEAIAQCIREVEEAAVLDVDSDTDHNRCVITFAGSPAGVGEAAVRATGKASELIDLNQQDGVHPRIGAADVVPFVPLRRVTIIECGWIAHSVGAEIWNRFHVPVYLYGEAAILPERRHLPNVRQIGFERLREAVKTDIHRFPDYGQAELHPTAGAVAVGARKILIAWNIEIDTADIEIAKAISATVRETNGGFPGVRALGLSMKSRGITQVSINVTDFEATPPHIILPRVEQLAAEHGARVTGTELIGLIPQKALDMAVEAGVDLRIANFSPGRTIEARLQAAGL